MPVLGVLYVGSRENRRHIIKNDPFQGKKGGRGGEGLQG